MAAKGGGSGQQPRAAWGERQEKLVAVLSHHPQGLRWSELKKALSPADSVEAERFKVALYNMKEKCQVLYNKGERLYSLASKAKATPEPEASTAPVSGNGE